MTDPKEIGNAFNEYFVNVGPNVAAKIPTDEHTYKSYLKQRNINYKLNCFRPSYRK